MHFNVIALHKLIIIIIIFVDSDSEYFISLLAFNNNGDGEATASSVRTAPAGKTVAPSGAVVEM